MKKEFYKLVLVSLMIVFAFALGFFMGREITLRDKALKNNAIHNRVKPVNAVKPGSAIKPGSAVKPGSAIKPVNAVKSVNAIKPAQTQKERVRQYKTKGLLNDQILEPPHLESSKLDSISEDTAHKANQKRSLVEQRAEAVGSQKVLEGRSAGDKKATKKEDPLKEYVLRLGVHKARDEAIRQSADIKIRYPNWSLFVQKVGGAYVVYIGPFKVKRTAEEFLNKHKIKEEFADLTLEVY